MTRVLLISNMYPSSENSVRGGFVERVFEQLSVSEDLDVSKCVMQIKKHRALDYLIFYCASIWHMARLGRGIVYCHFVSRTGVLALIAKCFFRRRIIINCHGSDVVLPAQSGGFLHSVNAVALKHAHGVIVPSWHFQKRVIGLYGLAAEKVHVYPSGGVFYPPQSALREESLFSGDQLQLGFVGSLTIAKGLLVLTEALNRIEYSCVLHVAGAGDKHLLDKINNAHVEVVYSGVLSKNELPDLYAGLDLLLFPTLMQESLGLVAIEAMAFAVPVIASRIGAVGEYVNDGENGFLVDPGSSDQLLSRINNYHGLATERRGRLRDGARKTAAGYDESRILTNLQAVFTGHYEQ